MSIGYTGQENWELASSIRGSVFYRTSVLYWLPFVHRAPRASPPQSEQAFICGLRSLVGGMSYLQPYGQPSLLQSPQQDNNGFCEWTHIQHSYEIQPNGGRCLKRRATNNRKERRRTLSINLAFSELRSHIPFLPADTKLSKIKTLRLATSYIAHLRALLDEADDSPSTFNTDDVKDTKQKIWAANLMESLEDSKIKKGSGRTGWPQQVWALELKRENPS